MALDNKKLEQFWNWFGEHGCFFQDKSSVLLSGINDIQVMKDCLSQLYWVRDSNDDAWYAVSVKRDARKRGLSDPMELLPYEEQEGLLTLYQFHDDDISPEPQCDMKQDEWLSLHPNCRKLI